MGGWLPIGGAADLAAFDAQTLRLRGIDPRVADYLSQSARFSAGAHSVQLRVNGQPRGAVAARFDAQGELCFDAALLKAAGLLDASPGTDDCRAFVARFVDTQVELRPTANEVELWVPVAALNAAPLALDDLHRGGTAGLLNYDVQGAFSEFGQQRSQFWSANTEAGFNSDDWIVRSRQLYANGAGNSRLKHLGAYAQRAFADQRAVLQLGQISLFNPVLSGARIQGVQWASEPALRHGRGNRLSGIAATRARVEVHQDGTLVHASVVAAGPFELDNISGLDSLRDVQLSVIEANGERHTRTLLSSTLAASLPDAGFSFAAGQLAHLGRREAAPWLLSAGWSQALAAQTSLSNGLMLADGYQALGTGLAGAGWQGSRWQATLQGSRVQAFDSTGLQGRLALSQAFARQASVNLAYAQQTRGHRELVDSLLDGLESRYRFQYSLGLGWTHASLGSLNGGYAHSTLFDQRRSARLYANWGRQWGRVSLGLNAHWQLRDAGPLGNALYISASLPLGERRVRLTARRSGDQQRFGVSVQERLGEGISYQLGGERSRDDGALDVNASVALSPGFTELDLGYANYGGGNHGYSLGARGAVMAHDEGFTLSAAPLQDTFALLSVGELAGVRVDTPGGPVRTDRHGRAVIARLGAYTQSTVEVLPRSLPRNIDINQGATHVRPGRGAVASLRFDTLITRRALLSAAYPSLQRLPRGASVLGHDGALITVVQDDGLIFVPNLLDTPRLWVQVDGQPRCELHFELPQPADINAYFESATAVCRGT